MNDSVKGFIVGLFIGMLFLGTAISIHLDRPTYQVTVFSSPDADTCCTYSTTDTAGVWIYDKSFYIITEEK